MKNIRIAKTYSQVFFNKALSDNVLDNVLGDFKLLKDIFEANTKLARCFTSSLLSRDHKIKIVNKFEFHPISLELLHVLIINEKMACIGDIYDAMATLKIEHTGMVRATLITASKMNPKEVEKCSTTLEKKLGKKFSIEHKVDESLIGGIVLKFGSMMYDASVLGAMRKLKAGKVSV